MSVAFYHTEEQRKIISETAAREAAARRREIRTAALSADSFYPAEDYHQKYALQQDYNFMKEFKGMFPGFADFVNSTSAARVNGILGGFGRQSIHAAELVRYGLSEQGVERLRGYLRASGQ